MKKQITFLCCVLFSVTGFSQGAPKDTVLCLYYGSGDVPLDGDPFKVSYFIQEHRKHIREAELFSRIHTIVIANPDETRRVADIDPGQFPNLDTVDIITNYYAPQFDTTLEPPTFKLPRSLILSKRRIVIMIMKPLIICACQEEELERSKLKIVYYEHYHL